MFDEERLYKSAIVENPDNPVAWFNLGIQYQRTNRYRAALGAFTRAYNLNRDPHTSVWMGNMNLALGNWEEGFKQDYERWNWEAYRVRNDSFAAAPRWEGQDLNGQSILLMPEGGYGDAIRGFRYIECLRLSYPDSTISCVGPPPFEELLRSSTTVPVLVNGDTIRASYKCSLLDVPMFLGHTVKNTYSPERYLTAPAFKVQKWKGRLPEGRNIGLCWAGKVGMKRMGMDQMLAILQARGYNAKFGSVNFISLQLPKDPIPGIYDWTDELHTWADTAALIENLDLVISIDTAVAHLAGALGKPTICFVPYSNYWPWLHPDVMPDKTQSVFYPTMRLVRANESGNWSESFDAKTRESILQ